MNRIFLLTLLTFLIAAPAFAQDEDRPVFAVARHQCDRARLDDVVDRSRERTQPILQALVDEDKLQQAGVAVHAWGDEYNLITWHSAPSMSAAIEGWTEMNERYGEAYAADGLFMEVCPKHQDSFYTRRATTQSAAPPDVSEPVLAVSYFICDYPKMGEIIEDHHTRQMPLMQALVDEGALYNESVFAHLWGDEWNLAVTRTARDLPALFSALNTFDERFEAQYGENAPSPIDEHCSAHKDNIYTIVIATN